MTIPPSAPPVLAEEPATARTKFLAALRNYESVACALDVLGATELGDAEQHVIAAFDAALLAQARQGREDAERLRALAVGYCSTPHAPHNARHTLSEDCCGFYLSPAPLLCSCCTPPSLQRVHDRAATPSPSPEG